jgi:hypothetical protein
MDPAVAPGRVLPDQAQDQEADGVHGARTTGAFGPGRVRVPLLHQVAVPPQHGVGSHDQPQSAQGLTREGLEECGEEGTVLWCEPCSLRAELPLQDGDLVAKCKDLGVLVAVAHGEQAQQGEGVGHGQVGESQQHSRSSCRGGRCRSHVG